MSADAPPVPADLARAAERRLLTLALVIVIGAYTLLGWSRSSQVPLGTLVYGGALVALAALAHWVIRTLAPAADPILLPAAFLLNGLGLVLVRRIDFAGGTSLAVSQTTWTVVGVGAFALTLLVVRSHRSLTRYHYTFGLVTIALLILPLLPFISPGEINGARLWIRIAGMQIQPGEFAKLTMVVFLAGYLEHKRALLSVATHRIGPLLLPPMRHLGPVLAAAGFALGIMVFQKDLGSSLLFFGVFIVLLYVATGRLAYPGIGGLPPSPLGSFIAYHLFAHVRLRVAIWLDPWSRVNDEGYQLAQSLFALGTGGLTGTGLGLGRPRDIPFASTDAIFAVLGEELGLLGATAVLVLFLLIVARGFKAALSARDEVGTLLAVGPDRHPRLPGVRHRGRADAARPAHRHHAAVRELRRLEPGVELRTARAAGADQRREPRGDDRPEGGGMSRQIRRVATLMLVLFAAMFINLNVIQLVRSDALATNPANRRLIIREYQIDRGPIVVGEEEVVHSVATDDDLKYLRVYEDPQLWSHLTGYYSFVLQRAGLEAAMNDALTGTSTEVLAQNLAELLGGRDDRGNTVQLTIDPAVQREARRALGDRIGAVVALDPTTGAILASYSNPGYDPNVLASHDANAILEAWGELQQEPTNPLQDRVTRATYPPGSTFKLITAAAALEQGRLEPGTALADLDEYRPPQTSNPITNFSPGTCTGTSTITLADALRVSCNTAFAKLGVDLGADALIQTAERFGYNRTPPYLLPTVKSVIPKELDPPATAQSAIGQRDVRVTPLQAAMVAAAIANEGQLMKPYLVAQVLDPTGRVAKGPDTGVWSDGRFDGQAVSPRTAQLLREMMIGVVEQGTGKAARIPDVRVAGKTGTAEVPGQTSTVWFVGFADDRVAVAVVLPDAGVDATGGGEAAPIARAVMEAALGLR